MAARKVSENLSIYFLAPVLKLRTPIFTKLCLSLLRAAEVKLREHGTPKCNLGRWWKKLG